MTESNVRRRILLPATVGAVILGLSTAVVLVGTNVIGPGHDAAARVAAQQPLAPPDSDILTDKQARERDRAQTVAERDAALAALRGDSLDAPLDVPLPDPADLPADLPIFDGRSIDCATVKCVALTFDDGPGAQTDELLKMLKDANAVATWFPLGEVVTDSPDRLRAIAAAGHEIGNHSWSHPELTRLSDSAVNSQITRTAREVENVTGHRPALVRPPYGAISRRVTRDLGKLGAPTILWDVDPLDWKYRNSDRVYRSVMSQVRPGSIVLMHDVHPTTVAAVPRILRALADRGYTFVTVSELFGGRLLPGHVYTDRHEDYHPVARTRD